MKIKNTQPGQKSTIERLLMLFFSRAFVFYVGLFLLSGLFIDYKKIHFGLKIRMINRVMPTSFEYLADIARQPPDPQDKRIIPYLIFYQRIITYFPDQADAHGMQGFCYYRLGDMKKAQAAYQKAIHYQPDFFWFHYNLGLTLASQGEFEQAKVSFGKAMRCDLAAGLKYIDSSKVVYRVILQKKPALAMTAKERFIDSQRKCSQFLSLLQNPNPSLVDIFRSVGVELF